MREKIRHKGKRFHYVISLGFARIYRRHRERAIMDGRGNVGPYTEGLLEEKK